MAFLLTALLVTLAVLLVRRKYLQHQKLNGVPLPPGPPGLPLVGNVIDVRPRDKEPRCITYYNWALQYGELVYLEVFGSPMVILNSRKSVMELLDRRSGNYSDRPTMHMADDLMGWSWDLAHMPYSDTWRLHRKTLHQYFTPRAVAEYQPIQADMATSLIKNLTSSPENFFSHVHQYAGSIILKVAYGYTLQSDNDPYINLVEKAMEGLKATVVRAWVPGAEFKRKAEKWSVSSTEVRELPWSWLKQSIADGTAESCFATQNFEKFSVGADDSAEMTEVIKNCTGMAYLAGSDTTIAVILSFILAMVLHPEAQKRAQNEIDEVVGCGRVPEFSDQENLPYIKAALLETLRWQPTVPLALPHKCLKDDVYEGQFIPAGATILANTWAILRDETDYPEPTRFNPDRFLPKEGQEMPPDPELFAFGYGRRICPGRHLAVNSVYMAMASILSTFTIAKAVDANGKEVDPVIEYVDGLPSTAVRVPLYSTMVIAGDLKRMHAEYKWIG
ncbi:hypothetical protein V5O48_003126 [Marasmius crinis-equi]|uniref:Cytochrome P450 n=1 Tax=Marasmius crinis-equi TaxID=585013 RepID=A0ABR3FTT2_9AGAR